MNSKNIGIDDAVGRVRVINYGTITTPLHKIRLDTDQLHTLMNTFRGPKSIYALDPNDDYNRIRMTEENYMLSEEELFGKKEIVKEPEPVVNLETETMTLNDLPTPEVAEEPVVVEEPKVVEVNPVLIGEPEVVEVQPVIVKPIEEAVITGPIEEVKEVEVALPEVVTEEAHTEIPAKVDEDDDFDDLKPATTETEESKSVAEPVMKESERQNTQQPKQNNNQPKKKYSYNGNSNYRNNNYNNKH